MDPHPPADRGKKLSAFAIIYFVWGSTFLAIRVGVNELPPLLFAALRFLIAGLCLYIWMLARGERAPKGREWGSIAVTALLMFLLDYGSLFWAEQRIPSGIAAVLLATIPLFTALSEIVILRTQRLTVRLVLALLLGIGGVAVLMSHSLNLAGVPIDALGAAALVFASFTWSIASILNRTLPLPPSKGMSSGAQMLVGGLWLTLAAALTGEFGKFHPSAVSAQAWFSLAYLIVAGSIVGFTAYVWLLHRESPTKVATYAYVNPIVAVLVGYLFGGEPLGSRVLLGTALILISVLVISASRPQVQPERVVESTAVNASGS